MRKFSVEMSLILNGEYYPESDIHIGTFNNFKEAFTVANRISVQDPKLYECYVYELNENYEIVKTTRVF